MRCQSFSSQIWSFINQILRDNEKDKFFHVYIFVVVVVLQSHIFYKCIDILITDASFEGLSFPVVAYLVFKTLRLFNALHRNLQYTAIM